MLLALSNRVNPPLEIHKSLLLPQFSSLMAPNPTVLTPTDRKVIAHVGKRAVGRSREADTTFRTQALLAGTSSNLEYGTGCEKTQIQQYRWKAYFEAARQDVAQEE